MADDIELPERMVDDLDQRISALDDGPGPSADVSDHPDQALPELKVDRALAAAHSRLAAALIPADDSTLCRECHEARPCTTIVALAQKYALAQ